MDAKAKTALWLALCILGCNSTGGDPDSAIDRGKPVEVGTSGMFQREDIEKLPPLAQWEASRKALTAALGVTDSYQYVVTTSSVFGWRSETEAFVKDSVVVARTYTSSSLRTRDRSSYVEDSSGVGIHAEGFRPILLDSIYSLCRESLAMDPAENRIHLLLDRNFIVSACGHTPIGCQDDCFLGVYLSVRWAEYR